MKFKSALALCGFVCAPMFAYAADKNPFQSNIDRGRAYLFGALPRESQLGYYAIGVLALLKTAPADSKGKSVKNPALQQLVDRLAEKIEKDAAEFNGQHGNYTLAVCIMALIADDPGKHEVAIRRLVKMLIDRQMPNGGWPYPGGSPANGDTSQTQYCILALWDASTVGIEIPFRVWDSAFYWHICTQDMKANPSGGGIGGFTYNPDKVYDPASPADTGSETCTMGVAGLGSMLICQSQIPRLKAKFSKFMLIDELIRPAVEEGDDKGYEPKTTAEMAQTAIQRAEAWVTRFTPFKQPYEDAQKVNYYLYGYERAAALRRGGDFKKNDWYGFGGNHLAKTQKADGSWSLAWAGVADTSFALLFLGRTMEKKLFKLDVDILPRGMAVSGEGGLPTADGAQGGAFRRQFERYRTKPSSSIDDLVKFLEDPDQIVEEETAAQVEQLTPEQLKELVQKAGGDTRKLRQWAYDKRPGARGAALTALARSRDPRVAPMLIDALGDPDAGVYTAARDGLRFVSRNIDNFGLPEAEKRKPDAVKAGVQRAKAWFESLNLQVAAYQQFTPPTQ